MKTKLLLTVILSSFLFLFGCSNNDDNAQNLELTSQGASSSKSSTKFRGSSVTSQGASSSKSSTKFRGSSVTSQTFPQAQQEVLETWETIVQSIIDGDIDMLISFHSYGPKFTEFKNGELRNGSEANEAHERAVFSSVTEVVKLDALDMQIAVYYGNVANVTFHSDFHLMFGEDLVIVNEQESLLFVKTQGQWKIVAEHHSPLNR